MLDTRRKAYLQAMGIDLWSAREPCVAVTPVVAKQVVGSTVQTPEPLTENTSVNNLEWPDLLERVASCQQCSCCHSRMHSVFGSGNRQADLLIIAGAPDPDENQSGEPFVGKAGQMLNAMLKTIGFRRDQVYLTNLLKCHPAANRSPKVEEITACRAYLDRQIELVQPKMIIVMGEAAAQGLLCEKSGLDLLRGKLHQHLSTNTPILSSYHPSFLLDHPEEKAKTWQDLQFLYRELNEVVEP